MAWSPDYVTALELRSYVRIDDPDDDVQLALAVAAASRAVDTHTHRQFGQVDSVEERTYTAEWDRRRCRWIVGIDDVQEIAGLIVQTEGGVIDAYTLEPVNAAQKGKPFTSLVVGSDSTIKPSGSHTEPPLVTIEALWGWTAVPVTIKQATLLQASRFHKRRDAPFGVAGSPADGSEMRLLARVDPDVAVSLAGYVRWWAAA